MHGGPRHQSPHAPVRVSESNTAGTFAAVSGFAAPQSCTLASAGRSVPGTSPAARSNASSISFFTFAATSAGTASWGHLLSLAYVGVLCTTQHSPPREPGAGSSAPAALRRLAVTFEHHATASEPTTCAPSIAAAPFGSATGSSNASMSAHTEDRISLRCRLSSCVGRTPNAH